MTGTPPPLESERVVVAAPMSFAGAWGRIVRTWRSWRASDLAGRPGFGIVLSVLVWVVLAIAVVAWWAFIVGWYLIWGLLLVPFRILRRGSRKRKAETLRHRETLAAIQGQQSYGAPPPAPVDDGPPPPPPA